MGRGHTLLTRVEMGTYKIHAILNKFQFFSIFCTLLNFLQTFKGLYIDWPQRWNKKEFALRNYNNIFLFLHKIEPTQEEQKI